MRFGRFKRNVHLKNCVIAIQEINWYQNKKNNNQLAVTSYKIF